MAAINDAAAAAWGVGESIPVAGQVFTGLKKVGEIPVIKKIGDLIGDGLRGIFGGTQKSQTQLDREAIEAASAKVYEAKAADIALKTQISDLYAIDYGMSAPDARGISRPINALGGISINGKIVQLPTDARQLGLSKSYPGLGQQILNNIRNGVPTSTGITQGNAGSVYGSGAADIMGSLGGGNKTTIIIIVAVVLLGIAFLLTTKK